MHVITAEYIREIIEKDLTEKGFFLVDIRVMPSGKIMVFADSFSGITLDDCVWITQVIESKALPGLEDYELEVSSPGLDNPLKLPVQYRKNTGRFIRVVDTGGLVREGRIQSADDRKFTLEIPGKGKKMSKDIAPQIIEISYTAVKTAKLLIR